MIELDRRTFLASTAAVALVTLTPAEALAQRRRRRRRVAGGGAAQARRLYDEIFEARLRLNPEQATSLGLDTGARAALRAQLADTSYANRFGSLTALLEARPRLQAIQRAGLGLREKGWLDTALWFGDRAREITRFNYGGFDGYPIPYVISQLTGSYSNVPDFLDTTHPIESRADAEAYLSRVGLFARNVDYEVQRARADAGRGVIPPTYIIDKALTQTRALRGDLGDDGTLVGSLVRRTREKGLRGDWGRRAGQLARGPLAAALDRQIEALTDLRRRATPDAAVSRLPNGGEFYQTALRYHTSTNLTPDEAHRIGLQQVAEISAQADTLLWQQGLTQGSVGARIRALGQDERYLYPNTDAGRQEVLTYVRRLLSEARARMPQAFHTIPTSGMEVRRVPPTIEVGAPRGYAQGGSLDGTRPGAYYINLRDTRSWPKWALPTLTYHEAVPGHLWQGAIVNAAQNVPLLHRSLGIAAFGEGWGLYAEQLGDEIGLYREDPVGRIGMLQSFLYRAARIVMDTGLHSKGWRREQTIRYFTETVGLDELSSTSEVERYIVWPGQATSYKLGHSEIVRIREETRRRLGSRFDLKAFHDLILLSGDMPLEVLAGMARQWDGSRVA